MRALVFMSFSYFMLSDTEFSYLVSGFIYVYWSVNVCYIRVCHCSNSGDSTVGKSAIAQVFHSDYSQFPKNYTMVTCAYW